MKKNIILILILMLLCGCSKKPDAYSFPNPVEEIVSIELLHNQNEDGEGTKQENFYLIKELNEEEIPAFMNEIYSLQTERTGTPPPWGYGAYIARITYVNGDIEMFGTLHIEYIANGSSPTGVGSYQFSEDSEDSFEDLFMEYAEQIE